VAFIRLSQALLWIGLALIAGAPRIVGALLLKNADGDAYSYIESIEAMRAALIAGTFSVRNLFGFWLPLYQFFCAAISAIVGHPFYVAKLISALCGVEVCLLVFRISLQLTHHRVVSLMAFALIALNPLHILYSASSMTDVPYAFLVLASLSFAIDNRWAAAATCAAIAGLVRVEAWSFIVLLPLLRFFTERKVSLYSCAIPVLAPLLWFYICWAATGNPFEQFEMRNVYIREYLAFQPEQATFSRAVIALDIGRLLYSANIVVLTTGLIGGWLAARQAWVSGCISKPDGGIVAVCLYFFSSLTFLLLAYVTKNQPVIWVRYGLILFALGIPILVWTPLALMQLKPRSLKTSERPTSYVRRRKRQNVLRPTSDVRNVRTSDVRCPTSVSKTDVGRRTYRRRTLIRVRHALARLTRRRGEDDAETRGRGDAGKWTVSASVLLAVVCLWCTAPQFVDGFKFIGEISPQEVVARYLEAEHRANPQLRVFCDDVAVRVLSGIPPARFLSTPYSPREADAFLEHLKKNGVEYLVYVGVEGSTPVKLFPELAHGVGKGLFQTVMRASPEGWHTSVWLYRFTGGIR